MRKHNLFIILLCVAVNMLHASDNQPNDRDKELMNYTQKFKFILDAVNKFYPDSVNFKEIAETAFRAMLQKLDQQSTYYSAEQREAMKERYQGSATGIGITLQSIRDTLTVVSIAKGSPADSTKLLPGDKILYLNGKATVNLNQSEVSKEIHGEQGTNVNLVVRRDYSQSLLEFNIKRQSFPVSSVAGSFIINGTDIGYIYLNNFNRNSDSEFVAEVEHLHRLGMGKLIIDVRGNPGGYLEQVAKMVNEFLPAGKKITYTDAKSPEFLFNYTSNGEGRYQNIPLVIIVDKNSASASEILAGVVQDLDRGLVVGEITFGKGSVQRIWDFKDSSAIKLTVANYYTPSGRSIEKNKYRSGDSTRIDPSVEMYLDPAARKQLNDMLKTFGGKSNLPIYQTESGRTILGGGGIFPDYLASKDTTSALTSVLNQKGIFLEYTFDYLIKHKEEIMHKYGINFNKFANDFNVDSSMINEFINLAKARKIWNESMYISDKELFPTLIKSTIANTLWGTDGMKSAMMQIDKPFQKAIEIMPGAEKMIIKK